MAELDPNRPDPSTTLLLRGVGLAVIVATVIAGAAAAVYGVRYWQTHGGEPLTDATRRGDEGALRWRLAAGAAPDAPAQDGKTPLIAAVQAGNETQARTLLEAGANPNLALASGLTPLMAAASGSNEALVGVLLEHGADPTITAASPKGRIETALTIAARYDQFFVVRLLLAQGNARGQHVDDAFVRVVAQRGSSDRMLRLLLASDVSEAAKAAALEQAPPERAQLLLDLGVRPRAG